MVICTILGANFGPYKAGLSNIVVSYNPTDPCPKPPTQKIFWDFLGKIATRHISAEFSGR